LKGSCLVVAFNADGGGSRRWNHVAAARWIKLARGSGLAGPRGLGSVATRPGLGNTRVDTLGALTRACHQCTPTIGNAAMRIGFPAKWTLVRIGLPASAGPGGRPAVDLRPDEPSGRGDFIAAQDIQGGIRGLVRGLGQDPSTRCVTVPSPQARCGEPHMSTIC
jgi:hypothetical protein